jgi:hypothetical protein
MPRLTPPLEPIAARRIRRPILAVAAAFLVAAIVLAGVPGTGQVPAPAAADAAPGPAPAAADTAPGPAPAAADTAPGPAPAAADAAPGPARVRQAQGGPYRLVDTWPLPRHDIVPLDVAVSPEGDLYLADGVRRQILAFNPQGRVAWRWDAPPVAGTSGAYVQPICLAVDADRDRVHVLWQLRAASGAPAERVWLESRRRDGTSVLAATVITPQDVEDFAVHQASGDLVVLADGLVSRLRAADGRTVSTFVAVYPYRRVGRIVGGR